MKSPNFFLSYAKFLVLGFYFGFGAWFGIRSGIVAMDTLNLLVSEASEFLHWRSLG